MSLSRRKQQCSARTGLLDVVQAVPRLLDECIASVSDFDGIGGVRVFGWISTQARTLSLTAVTSYKMHLSLESEGSEQLSEVARLLKHGKLQRLHVHVITPLGEWQEWGCVKCIFAGDNYQLGPLKLNTLLLLIYSSYCL